MTGLVILCPAPPDFHRTLQRALHLGNVYAHPAIAEDHWVVRVDMLAVLPRLGLTVASEGEPLAGMRLVRLVPDWEADDLIPESARTFTLFGGQRIPWERSGRCPVPDDPGGERVP